MDDTMTAIDNWSRDIAEAARAAEADVPPAVAALMQMLPPQGALWPKATKAKWLMALGAVFAMCYPDPDE